MDFEVEKWIWGRKMDSSMKVQDLRNSGLDLRLPAIKKDIGIIFLKKK